MGANYIPATAINELEMWQAETFDPKRIDSELGWAESIGMNTMRVFLHDLPWKQDPAGLQKADRYIPAELRQNIRSVRCSCYSIRAGIHSLSQDRSARRNRAFTTRVGCRVRVLEALRDKSQYPRLEAYVKGVVSAFANDKRVLAWDLWNEPDNPNTSSYGKLELAEQGRLCRGTAPENIRVGSRGETIAAFNQRRLERRTIGRPSRKLTPIEKAQIEFSDVISFHSYESSGTSSKNAYNPCSVTTGPSSAPSTWLRGNQSTFEGIPAGSEEVQRRMINWGLVAGKTQTFLPWDSWQKPYTDREPAIWFHEVFRTDGKPYKPAEVEFIRQMTSQAKAKAD